MMVEGNPLEDVANMRNVRRVIANGRLYELEDLIKDSAPRPTPTTAAR